LELDYNFNIELNNLPNSIKKIKFYSNSQYNKELNCLPNSIEYLKLPKEYNKKISKIPTGLKKISCSKNYLWTDDFKSTNSIQIEIYNE